MPLNRGSKLTTSPGWALHCSATSLATGLASKPENVIPQDSCTTFKVADHPPMILQLTAAGQSHTRPDRIRVLSLDALGQCTCRRQNQARTFIREHSERLPYSRLAFGDSSLIVVESICHLRCLYSHGREGLRVVTKPPAITMTQAQPDIEAYCSLRHAGFEALPSAGIVQGEITSPRSFSCCSK